MLRKRSLRSWRIAGLAVFGTLMLAGCDRARVEDALRFGWPVGITDQAEKMRVLWSWTVVAALIVGILMWGLMFWTITFHRKKSEELPRQTAYNLPIELAYTAAPFVMIAVLFYYVVVTQNFVLDKKNPDHKVDVTAFKWNWKFDYENTKDAKTELPVATIGSTEEIPVLVLPAGSKILFTVHSNDVVHSFWVPEFLYKLDVFPDAPVHPGANQFMVTIKDGTEGAYVGRCAELCGTYHAQMNFEVRVVSPDKYDQYLKAREDGMINSDALKSIGEAPLATSTHPFNPSRTVDTALK